MLSRTADHLFWMSRYMERAENLARLPKPYRRYAIEANQGTTNLATFRAIAKKYPHKQPEEILRDLVASTPGAEGKWFAAAKDAGLFNAAIELGMRSPTDPRTLTRAARDYAEKQPAFALAAGLAALRWISIGHGYEITGADVLDAYAAVTQAAANEGVPVRRWRWGSSARRKVRRLISLALQALDSHRRRGRGRGPSEGRWLVLWRR